MNIKSRFFHHFFSSNWMKLSISFLINIRIQHILIICFFLSSFLFPFNRNVADQTQISTISLPIHYYLSELEKSINHYYQIDQKGILCEDNSYTNNNNDNFKSLCRQIDDIKITEADGHINSQIKVRIEAKYLLSKEIDIDYWFFQFNHVIEIERDIVFDIMVDFTTEIKGIDKNLITITETDWKYEWMSVPYISFGPISFRVLEEVKPQVDQVVHNYARNRIDGVLREKLDFTKLIQGVWSNFDKPLQLHKETDLWNFFKLENVTVGDYHVDEEKISVPFLVELKNFSGFGSNSVRVGEDLFKIAPPNHFPFYDLSLQSNDFALKVPLKLTTRDMEKLISDQITRNELIIGENDDSMRVTEVYLSSQKNLIISEVYLRSVANNDLFNTLVLRITFNPFFNAFSRRLSPRFLTYEIVRADTVLINIFNNANREILTESIRDGISFEFTTYFNELKDIINKRLQTYEFNENVILDVVIDRLDVDNILMRDHDLYMIMNIKGKIGVRLKNLF